LGVGEVEDCVGVSVGENVVKWAAGGGEIGVVFDVVEIGWEEDEDVLGELEEWGGRHFRERMRLLVITLCCDGGLVLVLLPFIADVDSLVQMRPLPVA
jgi:hypothetical protein